MRLKFLLLISCALLLVSIDSVAQSIYLYYPGVTTGAGPTNHTDEVALLAISGGVSKPSGGGSSSFQDYSLTKNYDGSSAKIMTQLTAGNVALDAEIRFYSDNGGKETLVLTIQLKGTTFTSYSSAGSPCSGCAVLNENVSIAFQKVKIGTFEWNIVTNTPSF